MKLTELIVKCLEDKGPLGGVEIAKILGVPQKSVNVALGHLQRKGIVIKEPVSELLAETPYGPYTKSRSMTHTFTLKKVRRT